MSTPFEKDATLCTPANHTHDVLWCIQVLQTYSAGVDRVLELVPHDVTLCSARGAHDSAVAEWIVAVILSGFRQLPSFHQRQLDGTWDNATYQLAHGKVPSVGRLQYLQVRHPWQVLCFGSAMPTE